MEDDLHFFQMEDDLNKFQMDDKLNFFPQMKVNLNILANGRRPQFCQMEDNLKFKCREDDLNILQGLAGLASPAFLELGTAQPQLL